MKPFTPRKSSIADRAAKLVKILEKGLNGESAVSKLASIGRENPAIVSLILPLFENTDLYVRVNAVHTLRDMGESAAAAVPQLMTLLDDQDLEVLLSVVQALGDIGLSARSAIPQLILLLRHPDKLIPMGADYALKEMGELPESSIAAIILQFKAVITDTDQDLSHIMFASLTGQEKSAQLAVLQFAQLLTDPNPDIRNRTIQILCNNFTTLSSAVISAIFPLLNDENSDVRGHVIARLGTMGASSAELIVPAMIPLLQDSDESIRSAVVNALKTIGAPAAAPYLITLLKDSDSPIYDMAIKILTEIGGLTAIPIPELIQLLRTEDLNSDIYRHVQDALRSIGKPAFPDLIILLKNPDRSINDRALSVFSPHMLSFVKIPDEFLPSIIPELIRLLNRNEDERSDNNMMIFLTLANMGKAIIPDLIILLQEPNSLIRGRIVLYLLADLAEWLEPSIPVLLKVLKDDASDPATFNGIFHILARIGEPAVPHFIVLLQDSNPSIRREAIRQLAYIGEAAKLAIPQLRLFLKDPNLDLRMNVMVALASMGEPLAEFTVSEFVPFFKDINEDTRQTAVRILVAIGKPAILQLILFLQDPDQNVRRDVVYALESMGESAKASVPELIRLLKGKDDSDLQFYIMLTLGNIGKSAIPSLILLFQDPDPSIRYCALRSCAIIADTTSINITAHLIPLLKDPDAVVRSWTAIALGIIGKRDRSVIQAFIPLLQDPDPGVRSSVVGALNTVGSSAQLAIPRLILCLKDSTMGDRTPIVTLLGKLGKPAQSAIPHLSQILKDPNSEVSRDEIITALKKLRPFQK